MSKIDRKLLEYACKRALFDVVSKSKVIKENLDFDERVKMYIWISEFSYREALTVVMTGGNKLVEQDISKIRELEGKVKKFLKYSLAALVGGVLTTPVGAIPAAILYYFYRKYTDPCTRRCRGLGDKKQVCMKQCVVDACKRTMDQIKRDIPKCKQTPKPDKCVKKLQKMHEKWGKKYQKALVNLQKERGKH